MSLDLQALVSGRPIEYEAADTNPARSAKSAPQGAQNQWVRMSRVRTSAPLEGDCDGVSRLRGIPPTDRPNECAARRRLRLSVACRRLVITVDRPNECAARRRLRHIQLHRGRVR